jgi:hypothetical protein
MRLDTKIPPRSHFETHFPPKAWSIQFKISFLEYPNSNRVANEFDYFLKISSSLPVSGQTNDLLCQSTSTSNDLLFLFCWKHWPSPQDWILVFEIFVFKINNTLLNLSGTLSWANRHSVKSNFGAKQFAFFTFNHRRIGFLKQIRGNENNKPPK